MNDINDLIKNWSNRSERHKKIHDSFSDLVNETPILKQHRDFVEVNAFGFGERSFQWMWNLIVKDMPQDFTFLEVGVFRGQILSLIELVASKYGKNVTRYGVTPLSSIGGVWESDYEKDIEIIHDQFNLKKDYIIIKGDSTDKETIEKAKGLELDILYIDGGHTYEIATSDINNYAPLIKKGGYLVIDDCANDFKMPFGYFNGIVDVTRAVLDSELIKQDFEFLFSVVHIKVWRKK